VPVKIGILGCAAVADYGLIGPARNVVGACIQAVASRDAARGAAFAARHGIADVMGYDEMIAAPGLDAIYIPLPNALHYEWCLRAMAAGKAVLCEKPLTSNADEAVALLRAAEFYGARVMEAVHWRYHPLARRMMEIVTSGVLGDLTRVDVEFLIPAKMLAADNIRFSYQLGGGCAMDAGFYCINLIRLVLGEPIAVSRAVATIIRPEIDGAMRVEMRHRDGAASGFYCSHIHEGDTLVVTAQISGTKGELLVEEPFMPQLGNYLALTVGGETTREEMTARPTYEFQLEAFVAFARDGVPPLAPLADSVANMRVLDDVYGAAGMARRGKTESHEKGV
jgi:predicted dehydrogenase